MVSGGGVTNTLIFDVDIYEQPLMPLGRSILSWHLASKTAGPLDLLHSKTDVILY